MICYWTFSICHSPGAGEGCTGVGNGERKPLATHLEFCLNAVQFAFKKHIRCAELSVQPSHALRPLQVSQHMLTFNASSAYELFRFSPPRPV